MPIRFNCDNCGAKLKIGAHKAGSVKKCPQCGKPIRVPVDAPDIPDSTPSTSSVQGEIGGDAPASQPQEDELFLDFQVYDDASVVVERVKTRLEQQLATVKDNEVSIPRNLIYVQGGLLFIVAITFFLFGLMIGDRRTAAKKSAPIREAAQRVSVRGAVQFKKNNQRVSDVGAFVVAFPADKAMVTKIDVSNFKKGNEIDLDSPEVSLLRESGGEIALVGENGTYSMNLEGNQDYELLIVSKAVKAEPDQENRDRLFRATWGQRFGEVDQLWGDRERNLVRITAGKAAVTAPATVF